ncbi:Elongation factor 1-alpha [Rhynchospora pubera]|uniref:Elongation factor 1-alpha n=1 Tax=Rhynchospora pubera TaxID=906938 RepID=A0AAV8DXL0_9POAL|nr:Elongation factor 1-alpha [Rhynchospora pubera]
MPRKVGYAHGYDDDYDDNYDDDYGNYDDDYDDSEDAYRQNHDLKGNTSSQKLPLARETARKPIVWSCSICTFDNEDSALVCEICCVYKESFVKSGKEANGTGNNIAAASVASRTVKGQPEKLPVKVADKELISADSYGKASTPYERGKTTNSASTAQKVDKVVMVQKEIKLSEPFDTVSSHLKKVNLSDTSVTTKGSSESLPSCSRELNLGDRPSSSNSVSDEQYKPDKWMQFDEEKEALSQLNLAIVGHVDSGKSTLSGRLLHLLGRISKRDMHKNEKEAKEKGKGSFSYAWAMDESAEERERGITMTVAVAYFDSNKYHVVVLDSPGHKDFVPNMISGATQADAAILVVDACTGSFEAGMDGQVPGIAGVGQTKEHAQLVRSFGVDQLIVAVNKMDAVGYSKQRYDFIKAQLGVFLRSCGFRDSSVSWVPLSAIENQNLIEPATDACLTSWYQGKCLLDAIDALQLPSRDISKPLIMPICDVIRTQSMGQVAACGKLETGAVKTGSKVILVPGCEIATVRSIEHDMNACDVARAGDNVAVILQGINPSKLIPGGVICHPEFPVLMASRLELKILVLDVAVPILIGSQVEFHIHHAKAAARIVKIVSLLDQKTGKATKSAPRFLKAKQSAIVEVSLDGAVCAQEFSKCRALGRVFLRASGNTAAVGVVTRLVDPV